jgi:hypothetical protein
MISNRLRHLFRFNGIHHKCDLFSTFDEYCARNIGSGPAIIARERVNEVWKSYGILVMTGKACPALSQLVGYFIDLHIPLLSSKLDIREVHAVYRHGLSPEQQHAFPQTIGGPKEICSQIEVEITKRVYALCSFAKSSDVDTSLPCGKLLCKGRPNPRSVRYIRPQLKRCAGNANCALLAGFILRCDLLQSGINELTTISPPDRIKIYNTPFDDLVELTVHKPSTSLYKIVSKCIAGIFLTDVKLLMRAERRWGDLTEYIGDALSLRVKLKSKRRPSPTKPLLPDSPTVKFRGTSQSQSQSEVSLAVAHELRVNRIRTYVLHEDVVCLQRTIVSDLIGLEQYNVYGCNLCGVLHCRVANLKQRGGKLRAGVSLCIDSGNVICNSCNQDAYIEKFDLVGRAVRAKVLVSDKETVNFSLCPTCCQVSNIIYLRGVLTLCQQCFDDQRSREVDALTCVCGAAHFNKNVPILCSDNGGFRYLGVCKMHSQIIQNITTGGQIPPIEAYKQIIKLVNAENNSKRL